MAVGASAKENIDWSYFNKTNVFSFSANYGWATIYYCMEGAINETDGSDDDVVYTDLSTKGDYVVMKYSTTDIKDIKIVVQLDSKRQAAPWGGWLMNSKEVYATGNPEGGIIAVPLAECKKASQIAIGSGQDGIGSITVEEIYFCTEAEYNTATAINNVAVETAANAEFVNGAGQKVGKNYKGLVINKATGKKFINK